MQTLLKKDAGAGQGGATSADSPLTGINRVCGFCGLAADGDPYKISDLGLPVFENKCTEVRKGRMLNHLSIQSSVTCSLAHRYAIT